jgi:AraC-like DNA-binding protein
VFGKNGRVLTLSEEQCERFTALIELFESEQSDFRKRLILMYLLSVASELTSDGENDFEETAAFVSEALLYIQENCSKKILSSDLAWRLGVGRTTLMTAFKKYTGSTLGGYITDCRLKMAIEKLRAGELQNTVAEACGFGESCNMIRAFRRKFGMPPGQYIKREKE